MSVVDKIIMFSIGFDCDNTTISIRKTGKKLFVWKSNYWSHVVRSTHSSSEEQRFSYWSQNSGKKEQQCFHIFMLLFLASKVGVLICLYFFRRLTENVLLFNTVIQFVLRFTRGGVLYHINY